MVVYSPVVLSLLYKSVERSIWCRFWPQQGSLHSPPSFVKDYCQMSAPQVCQEKVFQNFILVANICLPFASQTPQFSSCDDECVKSILYIDCPAVWHSVMSYMELPKHIMDTRWHWKYDVWKLLAFQGRILSTAGIFRLKLQCLYIFFSLLYWLNASLIF